MKEGNIMREIQNELSRSGRCVLTRNSCGFDPANNVTYGLGVGSPDLVGVLIPSGVAFCIEVKTPKGRASKEQIAWWRAWGKRGVRGGFANSVAQAMALLNEATS